MSYHVHTVTDGANEMTNILDIINNAAVEVEDNLKDLPKVGADKIGLDRRAGRVWVDEDYGLIIIHKERANTLDYYGGFEYVDKEAVTEIGQFKVYSSMYDDRVASAIDFYSETKDEE